MASSPPSSKRGTGALLAMPLVVINMGAEMVYILSHRLDAQKVGPAKSMRVLEDVLGAMFDQAFVEELFRLQEMYSRTSTRGIFDKLAHSSIMKLNKNSMDKLYDLMSMGFKYQIQQCVSPDQLYAITVRHLDNCKALVRPDSKAAANVAFTLKSLKESHEDLPLGEWFKCRQQLLHFMQGRRVKVSLFLQSQTQSNAGHIAIPIVGMLPRHATAPGTAFYFRKEQGGSSIGGGGGGGSGDAAAAGETRGGYSVARTSTFPSPLTADCFEYRGYEEPDNKIALGENMYQKGPGLDVIAMLKEAAEARFGTEIGSGNWVGFGDGGGAAEAKGGGQSPAQWRPQRSEEEMKAQARAEISILAGLMGRAAGRGGGGGGGGGAADDGDEKGGGAGEFTLNLFPGGFDDDDLLFGGGRDGELESSVAEAKVDTVRVDGNVGHKDAAKLMEELDLKDDDDGDAGGSYRPAGGAADAKSGGPDSPAAGADDDDFDEMDMLALMDMADAADEKK